MCSTSFFFFSAPASPDMYTLSLHDALPISRARDCLRAGRILRPTRTSRGHRRRDDLQVARRTRDLPQLGDRHARSEEHTSELQSPDQLVCRLLLEKKRDGSNVPRLVRNELE